MEGVWVLSGVTGDCEQEKHGISFLANGMQGRAISAAHFDTGAIVDDYPGLGSSIPHSMRQFQVPIQVSR